MSEIKRLAQMAIRVLQNHISSYGTTLRIRFKLAGGYRRCDLKKQNHFNGVVLALKVCHIPPSNQRQVRNYNGFAVNIPGENFSHNLSPIQGFGKPARHRLFNTIVKMAQNPLTIRSLAAIKTTNYQFAQTREDLRDPLQRSIVEQYKRELSISP